MSDQSETYEAARSRLTAKASHALMELAMLLEQARRGPAGAQAFHDDLEAGATAVEFALRLESTSASVVGIERRGLAARTVADVLVFAAPGEVQS